MIISFFILFSFAELFLGCIDLIAADVLPREAARRNRQSDISRVKQLSLNRARSGLFWLSFTVCMGFPAKFLFCRPSIKSLIFLDRLWASLSSATLDFKEPLHQLSEVFRHFLQGRARLIGRNNR